SILVVPLNSRGRLLGLMTLVSAGAARGHTPADQALAEDLARHAALALDNARLYDELRAELAARRRIAAALRKSEEKTRRVLQAIPDALFCCDADGRVLEYLPGPLCESAVEPDRLLDKLLADVLPEALAEPTLRLIELTLQTGEPQTWEG